jgi:WD40 repeat protein
MAHRCHVTKLLVLAWQIFIGPGHLGAGSPLDALDPARIPEDYRLANQPAEVVAVVRAHTRAVASLAFSPDGKALVSTGWDNALHVYRFSGGLMKDAATLKSSPSAATFAADGRLIYAGSDDSYVHVWDVSGAAIKERPKMSGHKNRPFALAFSPDGNMLASGCGEPALRVWKMESDGPEAWGILQNEMVPSLGISSLAFCSDGKYLAAGHYAGKSTLRIWNVAGNYMDEVEFPRTQARLVAFSPKEPLLAFSGDDSIGLWEVKDGKTRPKARLSGHPQRLLPGAVKALSFSSDGKRIASAGLDRKIVVWDIATGVRHREWLFALEPHTLVFAPDGRHLAVGNEEGVVFILRVPADKIKKP